MPSQAERQLAEIRAEYLRLAAEYEKGPAHRKMYGKRLAEIVRFTMTNEWERLVRLERQRLKRKAFTALITLRNLTSQDFSD
jgi:hypothetical protein